VRKVRASEGRMPAEKAGQSRSDPWLMERATETRLPVRHR